MKSLTDKGVEELGNEGITLLSLADELETFIQSVIPDAVAIRKYGGRLFTLKPEEKEGQFCGVFIYKQHVQISFTQGSLLNDPEKKLCGTGKFRRHINFVPPDEVDYNMLESLLIQASTI